MVIEHSANIDVWTLTPRVDQPLERLALSAKSLDEAGRYLPGGAYTTFRTFQRFGVLHLADHFSRLEETARLAARPVKLDRARICAALRSAIAAFHGAEARVRVTLDLEQEVGQLYLLLENLHVPSDADYAKGVRVVTRHLQRQNPKAKLTSFIETAEQVRKDLPPGMNEAVMVGEEGCFLEGLSSNFFAVLEGTIWTAEQGVLSGITRSMVIDAARQLEIAVRLEALHVNRLPLIEEAFITSASRAVLPVTAIDEQVVGTGQPGPVTRQLLARYRAMIDQALEYL